MATSIVARTMLVLLLQLLLLLGMVAAQTVQPSNATLPAGESIFTQLTISGASPGSPAGKAQSQTVFNIAPLTQAVGLGQSAGLVAQPIFLGDLVLIGPSNQNNVSTGDIAYISCDPNTDTSNIDPSHVVATVGLARPKGIILFSPTAQECNLTGSFPSSTIYTMTSNQDSLAVEAAINFQSGGQALQGRVASNSTNSSSGGSASSTLSTNNDGGPAPTTTVAMSILYSITGIITLLFLGIIATGALRAHRHPERYGPRTALSGRPRQSRAKGLARAMLETLPIVKFGDPEPVKPARTDIELEEGNASVHNTDAAAVSAAPEDGESGPVATHVTNVESGLGPAQAESVKDGQEAAKKDGELGCSICTEDFTTGEDVRVLPCHHKYHPACIDPWLLNVSGTCPLCRHDLHPVVSPTEDPASPTEEGSELPPPLTVEGIENAAGAENGAETIETVGTVEGDSASTNPQRHRVSRFLDLNRLRHAPPDERIAALRRLREQARQEGEAEDVEEPSRRARLTARLRDTFKVRTRAENQGPSTQE